MTNIGKVKQTFFSIYDFVSLIFLKSDKHEVALYRDEIGSEIDLHERF